MRVDFGRLNWGVFLIVLGSVPVAYHEGGIAASTLSDAWRLWPLVVVGIGLAFVLSRTRAFFVSGLIVAATLGLVVGSALALGPNVGCGSDGSGSRTVSQAGSFGSQSSVQLDLQCGSADVTASSDGQWHLDATNTNGSVPQVTATSEGLRVGPTGHDWALSRGTDDWRIQLPVESQISLESTVDFGDAHFNLGRANLSSASFTLNVGSIDLDLTEAQVGHLDVETNLGSTRLTLDGTSDVEGALTTSLGSLDVCVPSELGVRVVLSSSFSSSDFGAAGLVQSANAWQTPNYATAAHRADLTIDASLGSVKFEQVGGCK
jgi:hypothetical protein